MTTTDNSAKDSEDWVPVAMPIPDHWAYVDFEEALVPLSTSNIKIAQKDYLPEGAYPVIDQGQDFIGGYTNSGTRLINEDRAVIVFGDHTKCFKFVPFPFAPGADGTKPLKPSAFVDPKFAYYGLRSLRLPDRGYSRHYSFLKRSKFPVAPRNEQLRIVAKIEELFSELDKGVENLTAAREQLKAYWQAVLKDAFEGKLTAQWRAKYPDKLETPDVLISRIRAERDARYQDALRNWHQAVAAWRAAGEEGDRPVRPKRATNLPSEEVDISLKPEVPTCWTTAPLGSLDVEIFDGPFGSNLKTSDYVEQGVRVVRLENIGPGKFIDEKRSYVSEEKYELLQRHTVCHGDIVFSSFVTDTLRSAIIPPSIECAINKADCFGVRFFGSSVQAEFAQRFLESRNAFKQVEGMIHGVGRPRINTAQLKQIVVPICTPDEQVAIAEIIDRLSSEIDALDSDIRLRLHQVSALRQSILKQAFTGQLVPHDQSDEPASVLLERIKAQKEENPKRNKNNKKEAA